MPLQEHNSDRVFCSFYHSVLCLENFNEFFFFSFKPNALDVLSVTLTQGTLLSSVTKDLDHPWLNFADHYNIDFTDS